MEAAVPCGELCGILMAGLSHAATLVLTDAMIANDAPIDLGRARGRKDRG